MLSWTRAIFVTSIVGIGMLFIISTTVVVVQADNNSRSPSVIIPTTRRPISVLRAERKVGRYMPINSLTFGSGHFRWNRNRKLRRPSNSTEHFPTVDTSSAAGRGSIAGAAEGDGFTVSSRLSVYEQLRSRLSLITTATPSSTLSTEESTTTVDGRGVDWVSQTRNRWQLSANSDRQTMVESRKILPPNPSFRSSNLCGQEQSSTNSTTNLNHFNKVVIDKMDAILERQRQLQLHISVLVATLQNQNQKKKKMNVTVSNCRQVDDVGDQSELSNNDE